MECGHAWWLEWQAGAAVYGRSPHLNTLVTHTQDQKINFVLENLKICCRLLSFFFLFICWILLEKGSDIAQTADAKDNLVRDLPRGLQRGRGGGRHLSAASRVACNSRWSCVTDSFGDLLVEFKLNRVKAAREAVVATPPPTTLGLALYPRKF